MEQETIYGQVVAKANNYQAVPSSGGRKRIIKNNRLRAYEDSFRQQCKVYAGRLINCKFTLHVAVYFKTASSDLDNSLKTILDCLQDVRAIANDNLCFKIVAEKRIDKYRPRIVFSIEPLENHLFE